MCHRLWSQWPGSSDRAGAGRAGGASVRGAAHPGRRCPDDGIDVARISARFWIGSPSAGRGLPVFLVAATAGIWTGMDSFSRCRLHILWTTARLCCWNENSTMREHLLGVDGETWCRLVRPFVEHWKAFAPEVLRPQPAIPKHPWLMARFGMSAFSSAESDCGAVSERADSSAVRRFGGAFFSELRRSSQRRLWHADGDTGACGRLADSTRWIASNHECAVRVPGETRRCSPHLIPHRFAGSIAEMRCSSVRRYAATTACDCRIAVGSLLQAAPAEISLWPRSIQGGLRVTRADSLARVRMQAGDYFAFGRDVRADCRFREGCALGKTFGKAIRLAGPAQPLRYVTSAGRQAHGLGVLSRSERIHGKYVANDRGADRAICARISRDRAGAPDFFLRRTGKHECKSGGRRHQWRRFGYTAVPGAAELAAVRDFSARHLHLLSVDPPGRGSARDVRISCGEDGSAQIRGRLDWRKRSQHCNAFHSRVRFRVSHRQNPSVHQVIL